MSKQTAAAEWAKEMLDEPTNSGRWTPFEVGEYHASALGAVPAKDRARLDRLFTAAGGERFIANWLNAWLSDGAK